MPRPALTDTRICALGARKTAYDIRDGKLRGFGLRVLPSGRKRRSSASRGSETNTSFRPRGTPAGPVVHDRRGVVVASPEPVQQPAPLGRVVRLSGREREGDGRAGIRGNHMKLGGPAAARLPDRLGSVFFSAPVPSG